MERDATLEAIHAEQAAAAAATAAVEERSWALEAQAGKLKEAGAKLAALEGHLAERKRLVDASEAAAATHNVREQVRYPPCLIWSDFRISVTGPIGFCDRIYRACSAVFEVASFCLAIRTMCPSSRVYS